MKTILHKADTRGKADHGWLKSYHTFSFASYRDDSRVHFGMLRVLNDDTIAGGMGFGTHPHANMEIISIPLEGALEHKDSMGNGEIIKTGDVQVMSAGSGVEHSEFNPNRSEQGKFLQIWVFPNKKDVTPRYEQKAFDASDRVNKWQLVVSPDGEQGSLWVHQNAWFSLTKLEEGKMLSYNLHGKDQGVYLFMISGTITANEIELEHRDGLGVWDTETIHLSAKRNAEILLMEVPMH